MKTPIEELRSLLEMAVAELLPEGNTLHGLLVPVELVREIIAKPVATDTNVGDKISRKAPEIVRCGECRHRDPEDKKCDCGHAIIWQLPRDDDWYCADAERRTDADD